MALLPLPASPAGACLIAGLSLHYSPSDCNWLTQGIIPKACPHVGHQLAVDAHALSSSGLQLAPLPQLLPDPGFYQGAPPHQDCQAAPCKPALGLHSGTQTKCSWQQLSSGN